MDVLGNENTEEWKKEIRKDLGEGRLAEHEVESKDKEKQGGEIERDLEEETGRGKEEKVPFQGYFDDTIKILDRFEHPLILVEDHAFRWMGMRMPLNDIDLLVRDSQILAIKSTILATELYSELSHSVIDRKDNERAATAPRFYNIENDYCVTLWSETAYMLSVDGGELVEVPDVQACNPSLVEEAYDPGDHLPPLGPVAYSKVVQLGRKTIMGEGRFARGSRLSSSSIFIPTLPRMLEAQFKQHAHDQKKPNWNSALLPSFNIRGMIRYLHLEKESQRQKILPYLQEPILTAVVERLDKYVRKPT